MTTSFIYLIFIIQKLKSMSFSSFLKVVLYLCPGVYIKTKTCILAQSAGAAEYTDCNAAEG